MAPNLLMKTGTIVNSQMFGVTVPNMSITGETPTERLRFVRLSTLAFITCVVLSLRDMKSLIEDHYGLCLQRSGNSVAVDLGD